VDLLMHKEFLLWLAGIFILGLHRIVSEEVVAVRNNLFCHSAHACGSFTISTLCQLLGLLSFESTHKVLVLYKVNSVDYNQADVLVSLEEGS